MIADFSFGGGADQNGLRRLPVRGAPLKAPLRRRCVHGARRNVRGF
jgi:hypothetical protein